jgi:hypothetical protein
MFGINFGLGIDENELTDSECEEEQNLNTSKRQKIEVDDLKSKFESLQQQRLKIKAKHDKKSQRVFKNPKSNTTPIESEPKSNEAPSSSQTFKVPIMKEDLEFIDKLEKKIDDAIRNDQIELAEQISDELAEIQTDLNSSKASNAAKYQTKLVAQKKKNSEKKKKLFWHFEAKQHWESKANM